MVSGDRVLTIVPDDAQPEKSTEAEWVAWSDEQLLDVRLCDLKLRIAGTQLSKCVRQLSRELKSQGLVFRPHVWLSDDWYCPDGVSGIAVSVLYGTSSVSEIGTQSDAGSGGGGLRKGVCEFFGMKRAMPLRMPMGCDVGEPRQRTFGKTSVPYPDCYLPKPYSKSFCAASRYVVRPKPS